MQDEKMLRLKGLLWLLPSIDFITAVSSMFGKTFLVSFPRMLHYTMTWPSITPEVFFLLTTRHMKLQVFIQTAWSNKTHNTLNMEVELTYMEPAKYVAIPKDYQYRANIGVQYTFRVQAVQDFGLAVLLYDHVESIAMFRALPVDGWGRRYFAITLGLHVTIIIVANEGPNTVALKLVADKPDLFLINYIYEYRHDFEWEVTLLREQSYVFSSCNLNIRMGSITGTKIQGRKKFGLISGNCLGQARARNCTPGKATTDAASEMLMPYDTHGRDFMVFYMESVSVTGYFIMMATKSNTQVNVFVVSRKDNDQYFMRNESDYFIIDLKISKVTSNKGIQLMFVSRSSCRRSDGDFEKTGDPSLCNIIPTNLFFNIYMWRPPVILKTWNYVVIIIKKKDIPNILLNEQELYKGTLWEDIPGARGWKITHLLLNSDETYTLNTNKSTFGCYLYGHSQQASYMYPAGFVSSPINRICENTMISALPGDLIDNDCDRRIDEEDKNGIDDDNDGRVDEDLNFVSIVDVPVTTTTTTETTTTRTETTTTKLTAAATTVPVSLLTGVAPRTSALTTQVQTTLPHVTTQATTTAALPTTLQKEDLTSQPKPTTFSTEEISTWAQVTTTEEIEAETSVTPQALSTEGNASSTEAHKEEDPGLFSNWSQWHCDRDCTDHRQQRKRVCFKKTPTSTCHGPSIVWRNSNCYINTTCPTDCPLHRWGVGCTRSCENCLHDCDKFNGSCDLCQPGFKNGQMACAEDCDDFTYGLRCEGNCMTKCGADCEERVNGTCYDTGEYSGWSMWTCSKNCSESRMYRTRICLKPSFGGHCQGALEDWQPGDCYKHVTCPKDCPMHRWNVNCTRSCNNCEGDCNKFNGSCDDCKPGFHLPKHSCVDVCPENTYGKNCNGDCLEHCGADCMDKATGACYMIGVYSEWGQWHCGMNCLNPNEIRKRHCNSPVPGITCLGKSEDSRIAHCWAGKKCPDECDPYEWGVDCIKSCLNCQSACDKFTGVCAFCRAGFKKPQEGCPLPCDPLEYGVNCVGDCFEKCGEECFSTVTGDCRSSKWKYLLLLTILTVLPTCYMLCRRKYTDDVFSESSRHSMSDIGKYDLETKDDNISTEEINVMEPLASPETTKVSTEV